MPKLLPNRLDGTGPKAIMTHPFASSPFHRFYGSVALFDEQGFAFDQGLGDLLPRPFQDSTHGGAGNFHTLGGLRMVQILSVHQSKRLQFIKMNRYPGKISGRYPSRFEDRYTRKAGNTASFERSWHFSVMSICS